MKIQILDIEGKKQKEIESVIFDGKIREDIVQKVVEAAKIKQPYAPYIWAGMRHSASGKIRHGRRRWKTAAGKGISRVPRKIFNRSGAQFHWEAATISGVRGGRKAHPPKVLSMINTKKINKKELKISILSALALTSSQDHLIKKYQTISKENIKLKLPIVIEEKILQLNTKEFLKSLKVILKDLADVAIQKKSVRPGKGKMRGRKYKKSSGALLVIGNKEQKKISAIDVRQADEVNTSDLASNGARLTVYTENAIKDLEKRLNGEKGIKSKIEKNSEKTKKPKSKLEDKIKTTKEKK
jgi:large subunit ribosomal protein L4e